MIPVLEKLTNETEHKYVKRTKGDGFRWVKGH